MEALSFTNAFMAHIAAVVDNMPPEPIDRMVTCLADVQRWRGRLYIVGLGGSAANASHAASDFRALCHIEAYAPADNVAFLTARANDQGFDYIFTDWLAVQEHGRRDALLVLSVGGGTEAVSVPLVRAIDYAQTLDMTVLGIVGPEGGHTARQADICVVVPAPSARVTPITEAMQGVILHLLVSHPTLQKTLPKWEGMR